MLAARFSQDTPLPLPGSTGYLRGTAREVTVIQRGQDGHCTVKLHPPRYMTPAERIEWTGRGASLTTRVAEADLYPTEELAQFCGKPKPRRRTAQRRPV